MSNNQSGAGRFGVDAQKACETEQRQRMTNADTTKADIIVIGCPTHLIGKTSAYFSHQVREVLTAKLDYPVVDRMGMFAAAFSAPSTINGETLAIFSKHSGVPVSIAERVPMQDGHDAKIMVHSVNATVTEMHARLSRLLSEVPGLDDSLAACGIHAILVADSSKSYLVIQAIVKQLQTSVNNMVAMKELDAQALASDVIQFDVLPTNPKAVYIGSRNTFLVNNGRGEYFTPATEGHTMEVVSFQTVVTALQGQGIATANRGEAELRNVYAEMFGDASQPQNAEWQSSEDDENEQEIQDAASTLLSFGLPRHCYRALAFFYRLTVKKQQDEADIVDTIVAHLSAENIPLADALENWLPLVEARAQDTTGIASYITVLRAEEESDEDDEESDEDDSDEDSDDSESEGESDEDDDDSDFEEEDTRETQAPVRPTLSGVETFDDSNVFAPAGIDLTHESRAARLEFIGVDTDSLNKVQVMRQYNAAREEFLEQSQEEEFEGEDDLNAEAEQNSVFENALIEALANLPVESLRALSDGLSLTVEEEFDGEDEEAELLIELLVEHFDAQYALTLAVSENLGIELPFEDQPEFDGEGDEPEPVLINLAEVQDVTEELTESEQEDLILRVLHALATHEHELDTNEQGFIAGTEQTSLGNLIRVKTDGAFIINFVLERAGLFDDVAEELRNVDGINYLFPINRGKHGSTGALWEPADMMVAALEGAQTASTLIARDQFNGREFATGLSALLNEEVQAKLYENRLEEGFDATKHGLVLGDFEDDETEGHTIPLADMYNARVMCRPLYDDKERILLTTGLLNIVVPGFSGIDSEETAVRFVQSAVNAVRSWVADKTDLEVYVAFTYNQSDLVSNDTLFHAFSQLRTMSGAMTLTQAEAQLFSNTPDVLEVAASLGRNDMPLTLIAGGLASDLFDLSGDSSMILPCFDPDYDEEEDDDEGEWEDDDADESDDGEDDDDSDDEEEEDE